MNCLNCHTPNDTTSRFCTRCGKGIATQTPTVEFADVADSNGSASQVFGKFDQQARSAPARDDDDVVTHVANAAYRERENTVRSPGQNDATDMHLGRIIDDKYRIDEKIGVGGMGAVYRAARLQIGDDVAIKILHPQHVSEPGARERFKREAQATARIKHPNAVFIIDFGITSDGIVYLVMDLVHGESLRQIIKRTGPLEASAIVEILNQICGALEEAHRHQVVHRDLKPDNIFVQTTTNGLRVTVLDFGIAKIRDLPGNNMTQVGAVMGTPRYMSPEQCLGEEIDNRSDIYSLGIVLYEMLTGFVPFRRPTSTAVQVQQVSDPPSPLREVNARISPAVEAVVMLALAKRREDRPQSARALAAEFSSAVNAPWPAPVQSTGQFGHGSAGYQPTLVSPAMRLNIDLPTAAPGAGSGGQNKISIGLIIVGAMGLLAIGALAAVLLIGAGGRSTGNNNDNAVPSPHPSIEIARSTPADPAPTPAAPVQRPTVPAPTPAAPTPPVLAPSLPYTLNRGYSGEIAGKPLRLSLDKQGPNLTGTASTGSNTDTLSGTIDNEGRFALNGYENGTDLTGRYTGQLHPDGSISGGRWTSTRGRGSFGFSVR